MSNDPRDLVALNERDNFITRLAETIGSRANADAVFGEPVSSNGTTVIPVARARWGVGGGGGEGARHANEHGHGFGGGGGMLVQPVGYLVIREGAVEYHEIQRTLRLLTAAIVGMVVGAIFLRRRARA